MLDEGAGPTVIEVPVYEVPVYTTKIANFAATEAERPDNILHAARNEGFSGF